MENQRQADRFFLKKLTAGYNFAALIVFNTLICFFVLNCIIFLFFKIYDQFWSNNIFKKYNDVNWNLIYPDMNKSDINNLLSETWSLPYLYEPFTQFKERPYRGYYVDIDKNGFRYSKNQGPWPPHSEGINIFLFGGSTTFGYGVSDNQTIASYLQEYLTQKTGRDVRIYNFGRGYYYSTQERLLYEQLLTTGFVPDVAIFIDGLNDFAFPDQPMFTDQFVKIFSSNTFIMSKKIISLTPLGQVAIQLGDRITQLIHKGENNNLNQSKKQDNIDNDNKVINRYLINKKFIEATSNIYGVKTFFIWQPHPRYSCGNGYYPFAEGELKGVNHSGYISMANYIKENPMGSNFIWCADIQKDLKQPLYVDQNHYSAHFSKILAEAIGKTILEKFTVEKRSDSITADHK